VHPFNLHRAGPAAAQSGFDPRLKPDVGQRERELVQSYVRSWPEVPKMHGDPERRESRLTTQESHRLIAGARSTEQL